MGFLLRSSAQAPRSPRAIVVAKWFVRGWGALAVAFGIGFAVFGALEWDRASASATAAPKVKVIRPNRQAIVLVTEIDAAADAVKGAHTPAA